MLENLKKHLVITFDEGRTNVEVVASRSLGRKRLLELEENHTPAFLYERTMGMDDILVASNNPFMRCRVCSMTKSFHCRGFELFFDNSARCKNCGCSELNHGKFDRSRYPYKFRAWSRGFKN